MSEAEAEAHTLGLLEAAKTAVGRINFSFSYTPEGIEMSQVDFFDEHGVQTDPNKVELNPYLPAHVVVWALRNRFADIHQGSTMMLQVAMQEQAIERAQKPERPASVEDAMRNIQAAARAAKGASPDSKIIL